MIGSSPFAFVSPSATRDFGVGPGFSSVESALAPLKLEPNRGALNIQNTAGILDFFGMGESDTTEQIETAPGDTGSPITFKEQLVGSAVLIALVVGALFLVK